MSSGFAPGCYYAVRRAHEICVHGPCARWQDAAVHAFAIITTEMQVKCLGDDATLVSNKRWCQEVLNQPAGWFTPMIVGKTLTLTPEEALGPPEIAAWLSAAARGMDRATAANEVLEIAGEAAPYLRHTPLQYVQKFQDIKDTNLRRLNYHVTPPRSNGSTTPG